MMVKFVGHYSEKALFLGFLVQIGLFHGLWMARFQFLWTCLGKI